MRKYAFRICFILLLVGVILFSFQPGGVKTTIASTDTPIYFGNRDSNKISIMINVYWGTEYVEPMLDILEKYNVTTTFFVGGMWVEKEKDTFLSIVNHGHEIANHGYYHDEKAINSLSESLFELNKCHDIVKEAAGIDMNLFAPPSGAYSKYTMEACNENNYRVIMWSKDTIDWRDHVTSTIYTRATKDVVGGDLILMHPTKNTYEALDDILAYYSENNLVVSKVSEVIV